MKTSHIIKTSIFLFACLFMFSACQQDNQDKDEITPLDIKVVDHYNATFDFSNAVESLDFASLISQNLLVDLGADANHAIRYEINFDQPYTTKTGVVLEGKILFNSVESDMNSVGNEMYFKFEDVIANGVEASGAKAVTQVEAKSIDWCTWDLKIASKDSESEGDDCLQKASKEVGVEISGSNVLLVNGLKHQMEIVDPIIMTPDCKWFTGGEVKITNGTTTRYLEYGDNCDTPSITLYNADKTESIQLNKVHNLW